MSRGNKQQGAPAAAVGAEKSAKQGRRRASATEAAAALPKKKKPRGPGRPFQPGNEWRIKPGEVRNPGGLPSGLRAAYKATLGAMAPEELITDELAPMAAAYRKHRGDEGEASPLTVAEVIALNAVHSAAQGDAEARREIRTATEGTRHGNTEDEELIESLREGLLTVGDLKDVLGDERAKRLILAAGLDAG